MYEMFLTATNMRVMQNFEEVISDKLMGRIYNSNNNTKSVG
jgi:hypothetical protein